VKILDAVILAVYPARTWSPAQTFTIAAILNSSPAESLQSFRRQKFARKLGCNPPFDVVHTDTTYFFTFHTLWWRKYGVIKKYVAQACQITCPPPPLLLPRPKCEWEFSRHHLPTSLPPAPPHLMSPAAAEACCKSSAWYYSNRGSSSQVPMALDYEQKFYGWSPAELWRGEEVVEASVHL
jgi:hypothetical protein